MKPFAVSFAFLVGTIFGKCTGQLWESARKGVSLRDEVSCGKDPALHDDPDRKCLGTYELIHPLYYVITPENFTKPRSEYYRALGAEHERNCRGWKPSVRACALRFAEKSIKLCKQKGEGRRNYDDELVSYKLAIALQNQFCADTGARNLILFFASGGFKCVENDRSGSNNGFESFSGCMREYAHGFNSYGAYKLFLSGKDGKKCIFGALEKCPKRATRPATEIFNKIVNEIWKID